MTTRTAPAAHRLGDYVRAGLAARARRAGYTATGTGALLRTAPTADRVVIVPTRDGYRLGHGRDGARDLTGPDARRVYATRADAAAALPVAAMVHDERTRRYETIAARQAARYAAIAARPAATAPARPAAVDVTHLAEAPADRPTERQLSYARTLLVRRLRSGEGGGYESRLPTLAQLDHMDRRTVSHWITYLRDDIA